MGILFAANDLENQNTKAEYIRFDREEAMGSILRCHVATKIK
jgi:hypothetical protein